MTASVGTASLTDFVRPFKTISADDVALGRRQECIAGRNVSRAALARRPGSEWLCRDEQAYRRVLDEGRHGGHQPRRAELCLSGRLDGANSRSLFSMSAAMRSRSAFAVANAMRLPTSVSSNEPYLPRGGVYHPVSTSSVRLSAAIRKPRSPWRSGNSGLPAS